MIISKFQLRGYKIRWQYQDFWMVLGIIAAMILLLGVIVSETGFFAESQESLKILMIFLLQSFFFILPLYFVVLRPYRIKDSELGFRRFPFFKGIGSVLFSYFSVVLIFLMVGAFQILYDIQIPGFSEQEPHVPLFGNDGFSLYSAIITIVFLAPVVEEIFYRGFLLQTFLARYSVIPASLISAAIFGASHFEFASFFPLFIIGMALNYLFVKYRSLWPCIVLHMLNNAITLGVEYYIF